jgi:hypothetical protein
MDNIAVKQCIPAPRRYTECMVPPLHSGFVGLAPTTLKIRFPISDRRCIVFDYGLAYKGI